MTLASRSSLASAEPGPFSRMSSGERTRAGTGFGSAAGAATPAETLDSRSDNDPLVALQVGDRVDRRNSRVHLGGGDSLARTEVFTIVGLGLIASGTTSSDGSSWKQVVIDWLPFYCSSRLYDMIRGSAGKWLMPHACRRFGSTSGSSAAGRRPSCCNTPSIPLGRAPVGLHGIRRVHVPLRSPIRHRWIVVEVLA